jgi:Protein of unknown function (DUF1360)
MSTTRTDLPGDLGSDYAADDDYRPLGAYAVLTGAFGASLGGALIAARLTGREFPERWSAQDLVLAGVATHKLSRLITKDKITSAVRAPFTRFQEKSGHGELEEAARGRGLRYAIGELLVCPYCIAQWVAGGLAVGHVFAPRTTRLLSAMWAAQAIADGVQVAYSAGENLT